MDKLEELKSKIEQFQAKSAAKDEIKAFVTLVVAFLKKSKENFESISDENIAQIQEAIAKIEEMKAETISRVDDTTNKAVEKASKELNAKLKEIKSIFAEIQATKPKDGEPGKDADEEKIVEDVLAKIKLPEYEVFTLEERGKEIVDEINALPTDDNDFKIDASHIKNLPKSGGMVGGPRLLGNLSDVILTAPSDGQALVFDSTIGAWVNDTVSGGGGGGSTWFFDQTPTDGGTYTLLQGDIDGANQTFTVSEGQYISGSLIVILNGQVLSQGADANEWEEDNFSIGTFTLNTAPSGTDELQAFYTTTAGGGGGNAAGADTQVQFNDGGSLNGDTAFTWDKTANKLTVENVLVSGLTASEIVITDASKNLVSAPVATYPSLTELAYVKGVTSAVQTQLDGKLSDSGDTGTGVYDFGGADSFEIPNGGSVVVDKVGEVAIDTTVTGFVDGLLEFYGANGRVAGVVSIPVSGLGSPTDGHVVAYNGTNDEFELVAQAGGGDVTKVGTPVDNQIGVWTGDGTIEGDANLTWDGTSFNIATAKNFQIAGATILADSAGTTTLSNIDALDATTEATIEGAIDTLANLTSIQGFTVTLADAGADAILGWDDSAGAYENLTQAEVLAVIGDASDTAKGVVELAIASEVTTGTDTARAVTPDAFAGSDYGKRVVNILVSDPLGSAITTGDGKACFRVPSVMNGWNLVGVAGSLSTVSSSGLPTFQVRRSRRSTATTRSDADMLSTKLSIDASEFDSIDATTAVVIDTSNDDVQTGDNIYIDIDVAGTGAKGLVAELIFQLP